MSGVRCQVPGVSCHLRKIFFYKVVELVGGGSVIHGATPSIFFSLHGSFNFTRSKRIKNNRSDKICNAVKKFIKT